MLILGVDPCWRVAPSNHTHFHEGAEAPLEPKSRVSGSFHLLTPDTVFFSFLTTSISLRFAMGHPWGSKIVHLLSVYFRAFLGVFEGHAMFLLALATFWEEVSFSFSAGGSSLGWSMVVSQGWGGGTSPGPPWAPPIGLPSPALEPLWIIGESDWRSLGEVKIGC